MIWESRLSYRVTPFGYWRQTEDEESPLPWPVIAAAPDFGFLDRLLDVEDAITRRRIDAGGDMSFLGKSSSRLTGEPLGSREFFWCDDAAKRRYVWPEDYAPHYLAAGVAPDPEFTALIERLHAEMDLDPVRDPSAPNLRS